MRAAQETGVKVRFRSGRLHRRYVSDLPLSAVRRTTISRSASRYQPFDEPLLATNRAAIRSSAQGQRDTENRVMSTGLFLPLYINYV